MSEADFGLVDVCCIAESDGQSIRDTLERLRKSYTEESGLIHMEDFMRAAFGFPWINPQCKIYAMMMCVQAIEYQQYRNNLAMMMRVQAIEYQQYRNNLEEKVKQAVKDGIQMGASHERLAQSQNEQQAVEKAMEDYYVRIITALRDERRIKEVVKERIEKEKKQKGRHGAMITIAPILEYIDALHFAESCARIARWQDARADEKSEEHKSIIAAGSDSNEAIAATNPRREHSGSSSLSISEQQAVEKAMRELRARLVAANAIGCDWVLEYIDSRYPTRPNVKSGEPKVKK